LDCSFLIQTHGESHTFWAASLLRRSLWTREIISTQWQIAASWKWMPCLYFE
jgi:hypothetical protein